MWRRLLRLCHKCRQVVAHLFLSLTCSFMFNTTFESTYLVLEDQLDERGSCLFIKHLIRVKIKGYNSDEPDLVTSELIPCYLLGSPILDYIVLLASWVVAFS